MTTSAGIGEDPTRRLVLLEEETASQRAELERRAEILIAYENEIDVLSRAVTELSASRQELGEMLRATEIASAQRQADTDAALAEARAELARLLQSRSFRLTSPLRRLRGYMARK